MRVEAIQNEVARLRAVERARMLSAFRRSNAVTGASASKTSYVSELDRPFDVYVENAVPVNTTGGAANFQDGVLA